MDEVLRSRAAGLLSAAPCSVEMPAGSGKTHLLGAAAAIATEGQKRSLVLTHTHAGVDAIRRRLRTLGAAPTQVRVETISSWAYSLARAYPGMAGVDVADVPNWSESDQYIQGATAVAQSAAIVGMHASSFDYLFVDEYQDCTLAQHEFVLSLARCIPNAVLFGDPLQAIFTFAGPSTTWDVHVLPTFPPHAVEIRPYRWVGHNADLGQWVLDVRSELVRGNTFDMSNYQVHGLTFVEGTSVAGLAAVAHSFARFDESVVLLDKWAPDVARHASRLGGSYSVMEDISGRFMHDNLRQIPDDGNPDLAVWLARFAKECAIGLGGIDAPILTKLARGEPVGHYLRNGLESILGELDHLSASPTYAQLDIVARAIELTSAVRIYRWEAWKDTLESIRLSTENGERPVDNLARVRDRLRRRGRRSLNRVASRTLLVKGLEYDHVVIADLEKMNDPCNLYVALSRARKSVTVIGRTPRITLV